MELLKAPIPGQSLTDEPKNYPWENPPEIVDPEEAIAMHMSKFNDPEVIDNMLDLLELGFPVRALAESILTASVAAGWHNIDISLIIAPFMHEHIKSIAMEAGVSFKEGLDEPDADKEAKERESIRARVSKALSEMPEEEQDEGTWEWHTFDANVHSIYEINENQVLVFCYSKDSKKTFLKWWNP